ncbi:unnamed protein product [Moneuplotes crassus]|uniref:Uncharacterized protein n=1 Tax=Euplotes crassus TaxID=5936 RepID=A0AAD1XA19_EUPCR|nr:unnamed protein product [Moneuplotes crassus]
MDAKSLNISHISLEEKENLTEYQPTKLLNCVTERKHNTRYIEKLNSENNSDRSEIIDKKLSTQLIPFTDLLNKNPEYESTKELSISEVPIKGTTPIQFNVEDCSSSVSYQKLQELSKSKVQIPQLDSRLLATSTGGTRSKMHYLSKYKSQEKAPKKLEQIYAPRRDYPPAFKKYISSTDQPQNSRTESYFRPDTSEINDNSCIRSERKYNLDLTYTEKSSFVIPGGNSYSSLEEGNSIEWKREQTWRGFRTGFGVEDVIKDQEAALEIYESKEQSLKEENPYPENKIEEIEVKLEQKSEKPKVIDYYDYESKPVFKTESTTITSTRTNKNFEPLTERIENEKLNEVDISGEDQATAPKNSSCKNLSKEDLDDNQEISILNNLKDNSESVDPSFVNKEKFGCTIDESSDSDYDCEPDFETYIDVPSTDFIGCELPCDMSSPKLLSEVESDIENLSTFYPVSEIITKTKTQESMINAYRAILGKQIELSQAPDSEDSICQDKKWIKNDNHIISKCMSPFSASKCDEEKENQFVI